MMTLYKVLIATAFLGQVQVNQPSINGIRARLAVAESLVQDYDQRWRKFWDRRDSFLGGTSPGF